VLERQGYIVGSLIYLLHLQEAEKQLYHAVTGLCASAQEGGGRVILLPCDVTDLNQHWSWENTDAEKLRKFNARPNSPA